MEAHALWLRSRMDDVYGFVKPMELAYNEIAKILWMYTPLSVEVLQDQLRLFVVEAACAGGWLYYAIEEERIEIFPGYLGSPTNWQRWEGAATRFIFDAEIAEWHSRLLDATAEDMPESKPASPFPQPRTPRELYDAYLAHFPEERIVIRDICWAAGQHYREWKRWLRGETKPGLTSDLAFRRFLTSLKRPREFKSKPRPDGWE